MEDKSVETLSQDAETMKARLAEIERQFVRCEKGRKEVKSDFLYWGYISEEERLSEEKRLLKQTLYYTDLSLAIHEYLDSEDIGQNHLKKELFKLLDEHKRMSKKLKQ